MPDGLADFLTVRLDEAETAAKERRGIFPSPSVEDNGAVWLHVKRGGNAVVVHYARPAEGYGDMADLKAWAETEHGWTRDRALRAIAAKRAILAEHQASEHEHDGRRICLRCVNPSDLAAAGAFRWQVPYPCPTVRQLGSEWADHPAYLPEWSPQPATAP